MIGKPDVEAPAGEDDEAATNRAVPRTTQDTAGLALADEKASASRVAAATATIVALPGPAPWIAPGLALVRMSAAAPTAAVSPQWTETAWASAASPAMTVARQASSHWLRARRSEARRASLPVFATILVVGGATADGGPPETTANA